MITTKDIGKWCFILKTYLTDDHNYMMRWENLGIKIAGGEIGGLVAVKTSSGLVVEIVANNVRVFEPRPQQNA